LKNNIDFGVRIPVSGPLASLENIKRASREAESLGFHTVWVHDQLLWSREQNSHHISSGSLEAVVPGQAPNFFESITTLSFLAGFTQNIRLGVAVVVVPLRNPIVLSKQLMNLDVISGGRLVLGIGAGAKLIGKTFQSVGVPFEKRGEITDDYMRAMLAIFDENRGTNASYSGKYSTFNEVEIFPKFVQKPHPPILVGGLGRALRRVALFGDGWIPANITTENLKSGVEKIKAIASKNGRTKNNLIVGNEIFASVAKDSSVAKRNAAATIASYARSIGRGSEEVTLLGSTSEVAKKVEDYVAAGVNMFELKFIYKDLEDFSAQLKLFASDVIPSFA